MVWDVFMAYGPVTSCEHRRLKTSVKGLVRIPSMTPSEKAEALAMEALKTTRTLPAPDFRVHVLSWGAKGAEGLDGS